MDDHGISKPASETEAEMTGQMVGQQLPRTKMVILLQKLILIYTEK